MTDNPYASPQTVGDDPRPEKGVPISRMSVGEILVLLGGWFTTLLGMGVGVAIALGIAERLEPRGAGRWFYVVTPFLVLAAGVFVGKLAALAYKRAYVQIVRGISGECSDSAR